MPVILIIIGLLLLTVGVKGKAAEFFPMFREDIRAYLLYAAVILIVGLLGYFNKIRPVTNAFLVLVIVALVLGSGKQFTDEFTKAVSAFRAK